MQSGDLDPSLHLRGFSMAEPWCSWSTVFTWLLYRPMEDTKPGLEATAGCFRIMPGKTARQANDVVERR